MTDIQFRLILVGSVGMFISGIVLYLMSRVRYSRTRNMYNEYIESVTKSIEDNNYWIKTINDTMLPNLETVTNILLAHAYIIKEHPNSEYIQILNKMFDHPDCTVEQYIHDTIIKYTSLDRDDILDTITKLKEIDINEYIHVNEQE